MCVDILVCEHVWAGEDLCVSVSYLAVAKNINREGSLQFLDISLLRALVCSPGRCVNLLQRVTVKIK